MRNGVESGKPLTMDDVGNIINPGERLFAYIAFKRNPGLKIVYEPEFFHHNGADGSQIGTLPDFWVRNPRQPKSPGIFVEVTRAHRGPIKDPKARQRKVMELAAPKKRYVVLYGEELDRIEAKHPEVRHILKNGSQNHDNETL
ncbi:hypothetical protein HYS29_00930 [Candidatus Microgenomates bacterium]|nr:hypothetical protein [Candidatus Microgenomates bacterium]